MPMPPDALRPLECTTNGGLHRYVDGVCVWCNAEGPEHHDLAAARAEIERLKADVTTYVDMATAHAAEIERLRAALAGCVEALEAIADQLERVGDTREHKDGRFIDDARAALEAARKELKP